MTGAQVIVLSMIAFNMLIVANMIKHIGVQVKPTTKATVIVGTGYLFLMSVGALYLYAN